MKKSKITEIALLAAGCAVLAFASIALKADTLPASAAAIKANAGNTFVLTPTPQQNIFKITADGVVQVSLMGNCSEHADVQVTFPTSPGQPILLSGSGALTSSDGSTTLKFNVTGTATPDPANPAFFNNRYRATFAGGSGAFASASGTAEISETVKFSSPASGTGTWTMKGYVVSVP